MTSDPSHETLAILRVEAGPDAGREFDIQARTTTIGRATSSDVVLDDDSVSEKHARIDYDDGAWRLTDLGSTNGTRVDGERLPADVPTPLPHGTVLTLGGVRLHFRQEEEADPEEAPEQSVKHTPSTEEEGGSAPAKRRLKLPLWAVALVVVLLVIVVLMLVAAAPATAAIVLVEMEAFLTVAAAGPPPLLL